MLNTLTRLVFFFITTINTWWNVNPLTEIIICRFSNTTSAESPGVFRGDIDNWAKFGRWIIV